MGNNAEALERTIEALEGLTSEHDAIVEHARTLARQLDYDLPDSKIHSEYRQVVSKLLEVGRKNDATAFERLLEELKGEAREAKGGAT